MSIFGTDGPTPVTFESGGKTYTIGTGVLSGKNVKLVKAEIVRRDPTRKNVDDFEVVDSLDQAEYMAFHLSLNCEIPIEEAERIVDAENIFALRKALITASGWELVKNLYPVARTGVERSESS